jgi:hypothetical protein
VQERMHPGDSGDFARAGAAVIFLQGQQGEAIYDRPGKHARAGALSLSMFIVHFHPEQTRRRAILLDD